MSFQWQAERKKNVILKKMEKITISLSRNQHQDSRLQLNIKHVHLCLAVTVRSVYPSKSCSKIKFIKRWVNWERQAEVPWFLCSLLININALPRCCHCDMRRTESECILAWLSASVHTDEHFPKGCRQNAHTKL